MPNPLDDLAEAAQVARTKSAQGQISRVIKSRKSWSLPQVRATKRTKVVLAAVGMVVALFLLGRISSHTSLPFIGAGPPYANVVDDFNKGLNGVMDRLRQQYPQTDLDSIPRSVWDMALVDLLNDIDKKARAIEPPPIKVDSSAVTWVSNPQVALSGISPVESLTFDFSVTFTALHNLDVTWDSRNGMLGESLYVQVCDWRGVVIDENGLNVYEPTSPGEQCALKFHLFGKDKISRVSSFKIIHRNAVRHGG